MTESQYIHQGHERRIILRAPKEGTFGDGVAQMDTNDLIWTPGYGTSEFLPQKATEGNETRATGQEFSTKRVRKEQTNDGALVGPVGPYFLTWMLGFGLGKVARSSLGASAYRHLVTLAPKWRNPGSCCFDDDPNTADTGAAVRQSRGMTVGAWSLRMGREGLVEASCQLIGSGKHAEPSAPTGVQVEEPFFFTAPKAKVWLAALSGSNVSTWNGTYPTNSSANRGLFNGNTVLTGGGAVLDISHTFDSFELSGNNAINRRFSAGSSTGVGYYGRQPQTGNRVFMATWTGVKTATLVNQFLAWLADQDQYSDVGLTLLLELSSDHQLGASWMSRGIIVLPLIEPVTGDGQQSPDSRTFSQTWVAKTDANDKPVIEAAVDCGWAADVNQ